MMGEIDSTTLYRNQIMLLAKLITINSIMRDMVTFLSAVIGLLIGFYLSSHMMINHALLKVSLILFLISISFTVASFYFGEQSLNLQCDDAGKYYIENKAGYLNRENRYGIACNVMNNTAPITMAAGFLLLICSI